MQRGSDLGTHSSIMRDVCQKIEKHPQFSGRTFSAGDEYIYQTAYQDGGPGSAREWRSVNTSHHITRAVTDIGAIRGVSFKQSRVEDFDRQFEFPL